MKKRKKKGEGRREGGKEKNSGDLKIGKLFLLPVAIAFGDRLFFFTAWDPPWKYGWFLCCKCQKVANHDYNDPKLFLRFIALLVGPFLSDFLRLFPDEWKEWTRQARIELYHSRFIKQPRCHYYYHKCYDCYFHSHCCRFLVLFIIITARFFWCRVQLELNLGERE